MKRWRRIEVTAFRYRATVVSGEKLSSETHSSPAEELDSSSQYECLKALRLGEREPPIELLAKGQADSTQSEDQCGQPQQPLLEALFSPSVHRESEERIQLAPQSAEPQQITMEVNQT